MLSGNDFRLRGGFDWVKAKPRTEIRTRIRRRIRRNRTHEARTRTRIRMTAEQNAACGFTTCGDVCIEVVAEIGGCSRANVKGHNFAVFAENQGFYISLFTGQVAAQLIVRPDGACKGFGLVANIKFRHTSGGIRLNVAKEPSVHLQICPKGFVTPR